MPNQPKTKASSFRFTDDELELMDAIGYQLAEERHVPHVSRADAVRWTVHAFHQQDRSLLRRYRIWKKSQEK